MKNIMDAVLNFINYWWFRYSLVTELYIVEKWERVVIHIFLFTLFLVQWVFNHNVLLSITAKLIGISRDLSQFQASSYSEQDIHVY